LRGGGSGRRNRSQHGREDDPTGRQWHSPPTRDLTRGAARGLDRGATRLS
jgi:hypothetical protein